LRDTPSKPVVERRLTEAFYREVEAMGELCDKMETRLRVQQESCLSAYRQAVDEVVVRALKGVRQPSDLEVFEREFNELKQSQIASLSAMTKEQEKFIEEWRLEFARETSAIIRKFHREGIGILAEAILADDATEYLDPDSSKH
jgi:uncharacterized damage-inducible protein DinB